MEWVSPKVPLRSAAVILNTNSKQISVVSHKGNLLRALDLSYSNCKLTVYVISDEPYLIIQTHQNYDLVIIIIMKY